jgi:hypothetical protein
MEDHMAGKEEQKRQQQRVDRNREADDAAGQQKGQPGRGISPTDPAEGARDTNDKSDEARERQRDNPERGQQRR